MDMVNSLIRCDDGGYLLCGYTNSTDGDVQGFHFSLNNFAMDCWLIKLDSSGATQWQHCYGGSQDDKASAVAQLPDGGFVFTGFTNSIDGDVSFNYDSTGSTKDIWVVSVDANGNIVWDRTVGSPGDESPADLKYMPGKGIFVLSSSDQIGGNFQSNYGGTDIWLLYLELTGSLRWTKNYGGSGNDVGRKLLMGTSGNLWIGANSVSSDINVPMNHGGIDNLLIFLDSTGAVQSSYSFGGSEDDDLVSLSRTEDNSSVFVLSTSYSFTDDVPQNYGSSDIWLYKFDPDLGILFNKNYGGSLEDKALDIVGTTNGTCFFTGTTWSNDGDVTLLNGGSDIWVVSLSALIGVDEISSNEKQAIVSPNPFSKQTTIQLPEKRSSSIFNSLFIYDLSGKRVGEALKFSGSYYSLRNSELPPGTYIYEILSSNGDLYHGYFIVTI